MDLVSLLIALLVLCLMLWCVRMILAAFSIGDPIASVVYVVFVLIFVLYVLQGVHSGGNFNLRIH